MWYSFNTIFHNIDFLKRFIKLFEHLANKMANQDRELEDEREM